eukprot:TRINITY_DN13407_c0_g2_i2.p1 TRINITY_DN13407_c0_g2~~TRINITY_DN13407_c0_g2_i2.p1  ORF type:complete len:169 (+),score=24.00 TRINITY_DN13407_c0_g2_i2:147-653(+)
MRTEEEQRKLQELEYLAEQRQLAEEKRKEDLEAQRKAIEELERKKNEKKRKRLEKRRSEEELERKRQEDERRKQKEDDERRRLQDSPSQKPMEVKRNIKSIRWKDDGSPENNNNNKQLVSYAPSPKQDYETEIVDSTEVTPPSNGINRKPRLSVMLKMPVSEEESPIT